MNLDFVVDHSTGLAIVKPASGLRAPYMKGVGSVTYRCHTCGELIPKHWEVLYIDPSGDWLSGVVPSVMPSTMTTHHDWHFQEA